MAYVVCNTGKGLRPTEVSVSVEDVDGRRVFLRVEQDFLHHAEGKTLLPVGVIHSDSKRGVLIELPHEADSGANRLWVDPSTVEYLEERDRVIA